MTIHKAQGLTLDDVRIDLGSGAFAPGQVYVAISRVRSMSGLSFARPLRTADIRVDPMLVEFMRWVQLEMSPGRSRSRWSRNSPESGDPLALLPQALRGLVVLRRAAPPGPAGVRRNNGR